jgi:hypothetical protein
MRSTTSAARAESAFLDHSLRGLRELTDLRTSRQCGWIPFSAAIGALRIYLKTNGLRQVRGRSGACGSELFDYSCLPFGAAPAK